MRSDCASLVRSIASGQSGDTVDQVLRLPVDHIVGEDPDRDRRVVRVDDRAAAVAEIVGLPKVRIVPDDAGWEIWRAEARMAARTAVDIVVGGQRDARVRVERAGDVPAIRGARRTDVFDSGVPEVRIATREFE